jgi:hypothetical protein
VLDLGKRPQQRVVVAHCLTYDFIVKAENGLINQPLSTFFQQVPHFWDGRSRPHMLTMSGVSWIIPSQHDE